jgi:putative component of toxin-antitoxin plasmid stabilization module
VGKSDGVRLAIVGRSRCILGGAERRNRIDWGPGYRVYHFYTAVR